MTREQDSVRAALRLAPGAAADPTQTDPAATPVGPRARARAAVDMRRVAPELDRLQEALYADGLAAGGQRRVLLVLQGMDTSGKGGTIRHVAGMLNPQGLHIVSFKKPTPEEHAHNFLWRIRKQVPPPGIIGVFDRSHYEDVLVARVDGLVPESEWRGRYDEINEFESELVASGVTLVKCFLHISPEAQRERLLARLDDPEKYWKYNPHDVDVRARWSDYMRAYADALQRCGTPNAPWYVVPSDRKWYRNWAVARILLEALRELRPRFPEADFDVHAERERLTNADPLG
jgi:PPK2 family polyphosphate:nucleotide phosphotransferase